MGFSKDNKLLIKIWDSYGKVAYNLQLCDLLYISVFCKIVRICNTTEIEPIPKKGRFCLSYISG